MPRRMTTAQRISATVVVLMGLCCLSSCTPRPAPVGRESAKPAPAADTPSAAPPATARPPRLALEQPEFDFGTMETNGTGRHAFLASNPGDLPLVLTGGRNSCGCCTCVCDLRLPEQGRIAPHQSAAIILEWQIKQYTGNYQQSETLTTNDPDRPEVTLRVTGRITPTVRVVPPQLIFSRVEAGQPAVGEIFLYGYRVQPLEILGHEFSDPAQAESFKLSLQPLSAEQLVAEADARSGCVLRVEVQPRLAAEPFRQQITLRTNVDSAAQVEIPVQGTVGSTLTISGFGWDEQSGVLTLGTVAVGKGTERKLYVVARGPQAGQVRLKPIRIIPDLLHLEIGPGRPLGDGSVVQIPWTVRIPPDSRPANHLGSQARDLGQIVFETGHPQQPELRIFVRFAVRPEPAR